jgi:hypothetical protein
MARFFCSIAFANATGITALHICGRPPTKHASLPKAGLRSWPRSKLARRLLFFSWCVMPLRIER